MHINNIKTQSHVSAAKKAVWHTSVLFTGTNNLPFSTSHISIITGPISIKFTYPPYMQHYIPNLKEISQVVCKTCVPEDALFSSHFSFSHCSTKINLSQTKTSFL